MQDVSITLAGRTATSTGLWGNGSRNYYNGYGDEIQAMTGHTHGGYSVKALYGTLSKKYYNMLEVNKPSAVDGWQDYQGVMHNNGHPAIIATPFGYTINSTVIKVEKDYKTIEKTPSNSGVVHGYSGNIIHNYPKMK